MQVHHLPGVDLLQAEQELQSVLCRHAVVIDQLFERLDIQLEIHGDYLALGKSLFEKAREKELFEIFGRNLLLG